jgi:hypothetical protein
MKIRRVDILIVMLALTLFAAAWSLVRPLKLLLSPPEPTASSCPDQPAITAKLAYQIASVWAEKWDSAAHLVEVGALIKSEQFERGPDNYCFSFQAERSGGRFRPVRWWNLAVVYVDARCARVTWTQCSWTQDDRDVRSDFDMDTLAVDCSAALRIAALPRAQTCRVEKPHGEVTISGDTVSGSPMWLVAFDCDGWRLGYRIDATTGACTRE